jgi:hypothetical protein
MFVGVSPIRVFLGVVAFSMCASCSGQAPVSTADASVGGSGATGGSLSIGGNSAAGSPATGGTRSAGGASGTSTIPCGTCVSGQICIYQNGGPGPSHYTCATQLPCGAMGLCACIQNQGTCNPAGGSSGLGVNCVCDNGLQ